MARPVVPLARMGMAREPVHLARDYRQENVTGIQGTVHLRYGFLHVR